MGTKMTVQFNLFGGTVLKLGSERHNVSTCSKDLDLSLNLISLTKPPICSTYWPASTL